MKTVFGLAKTEVGGPKLRRFYDKRIKSAPGAAWGGLQPLTIWARKVCMSDPDREMLRISLEDVSLGCTVFGLTKTDLGKPRNAFLFRKRTKSAPGQETVN